MKLEKRDNRSVDRAIESTKGTFYERPVCDIYENDNEFTIYFDIPGVEKEGINLKVEKDVLTLTAECNKKPDEGYRCVREEMDFAGYRRSFNLNRTVDAEKISADYNNGTLKVTLPKREEHKTKEIKIAVN